MREYGRDPLFPERLNLMVPEGTNEALDRLAVLKHRTKSEMARQSILGELAAHGLKPEVTADDGQMDIVEQALALAAKVRGIRHERWAFLVSGTGQLRTRLGARYKVP